MLINIFVDHLLAVKDYSLLSLSEELYELLGDCCMFRYHIEREMKHQKGELPETKHSYAVIMGALVSVLRRHDSFINGAENSNQAKALESMLMTIADVFSFYNKMEAYDTVVQFLKDENLVEYIFYEVLFYVQGKT